MALAIRFEGLVRDQAVRDYAELAKLGNVTRARMTQITKLLQLAPDIQEEILFLPPTLLGRDPIQLRQLQPIAQALDWSGQRRLWRRLMAEKYPAVCSESPGVSVPVEVTEQRRAAWQSCHGLGRSIDDQV